ncbi:hypothetical protein CEXT_644111 [Caerostris extrusa]|uniref:Uncharacterized protein n=1 Tax=Caerostris extrusa TaxID=172846 RepID=A0AAV4TX37_CAEEX|nr:hypothetical protein CEXT_644111 [Caerostris extrusa]
MRIVKKMLMDNRNELNQSQIMLVLTNNSNLDLPEIHKKLARYNQICQLVVNSGKLRPRNPFKIFLLELNCLLTSLLSSRQAIVTLNTSWELN